MSIKLLRLFIATVAASLFLSACMKPESPQEVARAFWAAAIDGDTRTATRYSTLVDPASYDGFSKNWVNYQPNWGKVVIDGNEASVAAEFLSSGNSDKSPRAFVTYLVQRDEVWLVDYERTNRSIHGGVFGDLLNQFERLSQGWAQQDSANSQEAADKLERLQQDFDKTQEELSRQATEALEHYSEQLREAAREMDKSLHRALEQNRDAGGSNDTPEHAHPSGS